jgi:hypothetical protein
MMISATTAMRSTSRIESASPSRGQTSEASAAASRKKAAVGTRSRSLSLFEKSASVSAPATTRTIAPKSVTSSTA